MAIAALFQLLITLPEPNLVPHIIPHKVTCGAVRSLIDIMVMCIVLSPVHFHGNTKLAFIHLVLNHHAGTNNFLTFWVLNRFL